MKSAKRPCSGCGRPTRKRYCDKCKSPYDYQWSKKSKEFLKRNPLCSLCERQGKTTLAKVVDHIKAHKGDRELFENPANWQALCIKCHNSKSSKGE